LAQASSGTSRPHDPSTSACDMSMQVDDLFENRGSLTTQGGCYYSDTEVEHFSKKTRSTLMGVSYCITNLHDVNVAAETFRAVLNLNFRYRIPECDHQHYEKYKKQGTIENIQQLVDDGNLKVKPPILEVMNSLNSEFRLWRISGLDRCSDPREGEWGWYVTFYCQLTTECRDDFEMERFPFTRQSVQIHIQAKQDTHQLLFVPFQERCGQPAWKLVKRDDKSEKAEKADRRFNSMTSARELGSWQVENHHVAFPPEDWRFTLPSGRQYSKFIITIQLKQKTGFFLWNTVPIVFCLPLLAGLAFLEESKSVADRSSIVLALLLTMATYKVSITSWMPAKDYLTWLDMYILTGFGLLLAIGFLVGVSGFFQTSPMVEAERYITCGLIAVWICCHLAVLCRWALGDKLPLVSIYPTWAAVLQSENVKWKHMVDLIQQEQKDKEREEEERLTRKPNPAPPAIPTPLDLEVGHGGVQVES